MTRATESCARDLLETVPLVMRFIRDPVRQGRAAGLSLFQFRTLIFLDRTMGASLSAAAGHLGLSLPAMSRIIRGLIADRLVVRRTVPTNRRQIALTLTARGRAALATVRAEIRRRLAGALAALPPAEQQTIRAAMPALRRAFGPRLAVAGNTGGKPR